MKKLTTMREALTSPAYFGSPEMMGGASWAGWRVLLLAIMGEELTDAERDLYRTLTDREREPVEPVREFWGVVGRRGGKSRAMGTLGAFLAGCVDHRGVLAPGQRGRLPIIAASKDQADEVMAYTVGAFEQSTALRPLIENIVDRTLSLRSKIDIQVRALSFRNLRGSTNIGVICDELAYWRSDDSATPDKEVVDALKPSLATTKGPLIGISSPYARKGVLYQAFARDFGAAGRARVLVAKAATEVLNPSIDRDFLAAAYEDDPVAAAAEFGAEWRGDLADFIPRDVVDAAVVEKRTELPFVPGLRYVGFVDASGGSADSMTMAIAHRDKDGRGILDVVREIRPPFSPEAVVEEFCDVLKAYRIARVTGDAYAGEWPRERFRVHGVGYDVSDVHRSQIYLDTLPLLNSRKVELLDQPRLIAQLCALERRTATSGKDTINHPKGGHDDIINAAAGALRLAASKGGGPMIVSASTLERVASMGARPHPYSLGFMPPGSRF